MMRPALVLWRRVKVQAELLAYVCGGKCAVAWISRVTVSAVAKQTAEWAKALILNCRAD